jgi:hypothetical protein
VKRVLIGSGGLRTAAVLFLAGSLLHDADHFRRGLDVLTPEVLWIGIAGVVITSGAVGLTLLGYQHAPLIAIAVGFGTAIGVSIVHLLPRWSVFSDSFPGSNVDQLTWVAVLFEVGAALAFGLVGVRSQLRTTNGARAVRTEDSHPRRMHTSNGGIQPAGSP